MLVCIFLARWRLATSGNQQELNWEEEEAGDSFILKKKAQGMRGAIENKASWQGRCL